MDIEAQKIEFIKAYLEITNQGLLDRFQQLLLEAQREELSKEMTKPLSKEQVIQRALQAEQEIANREVTSLSELRKQQW